MISMIYPWFEKCVLVLIFLLVIFRLYRRYGWMVLPQRVVKNRDEASRVACAPSSTSCGTCQGCTPSSSTQPIRIHHAQKKHPKEA